MRRRRPELRTAYRNDSLKLPLLLWFAVTGVPKKKAVTGAFPGGFRDSARTAPYTYTLYNTWEDHPTFTCCLARPMPRLGQSYNHGIQILQIPGYVVIHYECMHDVRIIPLDGRPHLPSSVRQWNGDSRGRWEGNTLVVDWTNFTDKQEFQGSPQGNMRFTERFTRVDAKTINYEATLEDPTT